MKFIIYLVYFIMTLCAHHNKTLAMSEPAAPHETKKALGVTRSIKPTERPKAPEDIIEMTRRLEVLTIRKKSIKNPTLLEKLKPAYDAIVLGDAKSLTDSLTVTPHATIRALRICDIQPNLKVRDCLLKLCFIPELLCCSPGHKQNQTAEGSLLHLAIIMRLRHKNQKQLEVIQALLPYNFNLDQTNYAFFDDQFFFGSALHMTVSGGGDIELLGLLLKHSAHQYFDLNIRDNNGMTPLSLAQKNGLTEAAKLLIAAGADPEITARTCCRTVKHKPEKQD